jgi:hypothetical protein
MIPKNSAPRSAGKPIIAARKPRGGVMIQRGRKSTGGEMLTPLPTFTESLLMEVLIQVIDPEASNDYVRKVLTRAGFTQSEIEERLQ